MLSEQLTLQVWIYSRRLARMYSLPAGRAHFGVAHCCLHFLFLVSCLVVDLSAGFSGFSPDVRHFHSSSVSAALRGGLARPLPLGRNLTVIAGPQYLYVDTSQASVAMRLISCSNESGCANLKSSSSLKSETRLPRGGTGRVCATCGIYGVRAFHRLREPAHISGSHLVLLRLRSISRTRRTGRES
jgi:hypothetical protein